VVQIPRLYLTLLTCDRLVIKDDFSWDELG
jgi:hypothetical protein